MGLYEDKMYGFLTAPENFEFAWEIHNAIPGVVDRLKMEAMDALEEYLKEKTKDSKWRCCRNRERLSISKDNWYGLFEVEYSIGTKFNPAFGLWHDKDNEDLTRRYDEIVERAKACAIVDDPITAQAGKSHPWYITTGKGFVTLEEVREILPHSREQFAKEYGERLFALAVRFEPLTDDIVASLEKASK